MSQALINVPKQAKKGEIIAIRTLISHKMETGFRYTTGGERVPREIIHTFVARYNGEEIFRAEFHPATSANPFLTFHTVATESGSLELVWTGDNGFSARETVRIDVV